MQNVQLPDGTWVTTPILIGGGKLPTPCETDCQWEDFGIRSEEVPRIQPQRCLKCGSVRCRYLDDPTQMEDD